MDVQKSLIQKILTASNDKLIILYGSENDLNSFVVKLIDIKNLKFQLSDYIFTFVRYSEYATDRDCRCRSYFCSFICENKEDSDCEDIYTIDPKQFDNFISFNRRWCMMAICAGGRWFSDYLNNGQLPNLKWFNEYAKIIEVMCRKDCPASVAYIRDKLFGDSTMPATHEMEYQKLLGKRQLSKCTTNLRNLPAVKCKLENRIEALKNEITQLENDLNDLPNVKRRLKEEITNLKLGE
jgi:hypothetical protein